MADEKNLNLGDTGQDAGTNSGSSGNTLGTVPEQEETLNAFQKFMKSLFGEKSEEGDLKNASGNKDAGDSTPKSYSEEELKKAIESAKADWEKELEEKKKIEKLSPEERAKAEKETSDKTIAELQKKLLLKELQDEAVADLSKDGFPVGLAKIINYDTKEGMIESLNSVKETFKECLSTAITEKLRGKTPLGLGGAANAENAARDEIAKNIRGGF